MGDTFDVFLSHSAQDKAVVRAASRSASNGERAGVRRRSLNLLRAAGLRLWFDEWVLKPGDSFEKNQSKTAKIEARLGFDIPNWHFKFRRA